MLLKFDVCQKTSKGNQVNIPELNVWFLGNDRVFGAIFVSPGKSFLFLLTKCECLE